MNLKLLLQLLMIEAELLLVNLKTAVAIRSYLFGRFDFNAGSERLPNMKGLRGELGRKHGLWRSQIGCKHFINPNTIKIIISDFAGQHLNLQLRFERISQGLRPLPPAPTLGKKALWWWLCRAR